MREAFERKLAPLPGILRQSLTYDQGKEMAEHQSLASTLRSADNPVGFNYDRGVPVKELGQMRKLLGEGNRLANKSSPAEHKTKRRSKSHG